MTVREIVLECADLLQADEIAQTVNRTEPGADITDSDVKALITAVNIAVAEANTDGFCKIVKVRVNSTSRTIPFSALEQPPIRIKSVRRSGYAVAFDTDGESIAVPYDGTFDIEYYVPDGDITLDSAIGGIRDRHMVCYLAARNFCLITGRNDEAVIWDQRYAEEEGKARLCRRAKLPRRVWR